MRRGSTVFAVQGRRVQPGRTLNRLQGVRVESEAGGEGLDETARRLRVGNGLVTKALEVRGHESSV